ncbi:MAG: cobyric acid synthase [Candidatus Methanomethylophilaceae archaeon]|nr:cobyric acid synthase [Candidatus Methanomethylophilaceae archaeon]
MDCIKKKVNEEIERGWIGSNLECEYHPCHFTGQDCTFCYCPFYPCGDEDLGSNTPGKRGKPVWNCSDCLFIHRREVASFVMSEIRRLGIEDASDERLKGILPEAKSRFWREGKAVMVVGATSDAGKSITVAAICRALHRRGYLVAPFKSQNMSLNSKVTRTGAEIAMIQTLQAQAAGLTTPDAHMNPILLKPKGDDISQVVVCGKPFADYRVKEYYEEFVPGPGIQIVKEHVDFMKKRYDYVVMEGAGSPAEINIYDKDIANMKAAEIADATVILVVNVEWGGSYAYALGTVELIPEKDRKRIKGIILNNVRGDPRKMLDGADRLEELTGVPLLGVMPHVDVMLPSEDSEALRGTSRRGEGSIRIGVVKFPRIANFTDIDPLFMDDVSIVYVQEPGDLDGVSAVILPGTKNTVLDYRWMCEKGIADRLKEMRGKVPILGICGGYQMMGVAMDDSLGIEGGEKEVVEGLGFFGNRSVFAEYKKTVANREAVLLKGEGGKVTGYELHMGQTEVVEEPLFRVDSMFYPSWNEGSVREEEKLFGTYLHGCFDLQAFRRYFLSFVDAPVEAKEAPAKSYEDLLEDSLDALADAFESNIDMDRLIGIMGGSE